MKKYGKILLQVSNRQENGSIIDIQYNAQPNETLKNKKKKQKL